MSSANHEAPSPEREPSGSWSSRVAWLRGLGLVAAVLAMGAALWVLQPRGSSRDREGARASAKAVAGEGGASSRARPSRGQGVAPRETTVAGDGWVRGQVVDEDGAAVGEGQLVLWCATADGEVARIRDGVLTLDDEGHFEGPGCRGQVCPELRHPARIPAAPWSLRPGTTATLEARLLPRLWGRVVDPEGNPVAGAAVVLTLPPDEDDPTAVLPVMTSRTSTDEDGEFSVARIERPPCDPCQQARQACPDALLPVADRVWVTVRAPGFGPGSHALLVEDAAEPDAPAQVVLQPPTAAITGRLVDALGEPLPRALVLARSESQPTEQHRSEADAGVFGFDALAEGPYTVRAIQDGRELVRHEGVTPGQTLDLELPLALRDVELTVLDEQGRPWSGVEVDGGPFARERSDAQGRLRAQRVAPGTYMLRIRPRGVRARVYDLEVPVADDPAIPWISRIELGAEG